ncbi:hypothetical protein [Streptomyces sp. SID9124]|uniref:hypothetical protein n=1 Tax=Streptomyces sp. SID9124 TaxID=2706108 RepID=UPI001EF1DAFC|nr:hypothetical protein [Streptomyces sp. SID9124]
MVLDGFFGLLDRDVRHLADVIEAAVAEEVPVDVAAAVGGVLHDHATLFATLPTA